MQLWSEEGRIERVLHPYSSPVTDGKYLETIDSRMVAGDPDGHICAKCAEPAENKRVESKPMGAEAGCAGKLLGLRLKQKAIEDMGGRIFGVMVPDLAPFVNMYFNTTVTSCLSSSGQVARCERSSVWARST